MPEGSESVGSASVTTGEGSHNVDHALSLQRCPVCRARLLDSTTCPRCGSDLTLPVQFARHANELERVAVAHLLSSEWALAKLALADVQRLRSSELCDQLLAFVEHQLLVSTRSPNKKKPDVGSVAQGNDLATLDLSVVERYG